MARLIDAWDLIEWLDDFDRKNTLRILGGKKAKLLNSHYMRNVIVTVPRVDAVEVVRCKDCKHSVWDEENELWKCTESADYDEDAGEWFGFFEYHNGDFFCAYGEREDNG